MLGHRLKCTIDETGTPFKHGHETLDMRANTKLIRQLKAGLKAAGDPERAIGQQAYMKSAMPYHGIMMPEIKSLCRDAFNSHPIESAEVWLATAESLWRQAKYREERYAALQLIGHKPYRRYFQPSLLEPLEAFIVSGAWWDYVDLIASGFVGALLADYPEEIRPELESWSRDENIWRRRSAIISQLKFKNRTDWPLLQAFIKPSISEKEFFLRKGIGWALREYSKTDPDAVIGFIRQHRKALSGLSKREGLKVLLKQGVVTREDPAFTDA